MLIKLLFFLLLYTPLQASTLIIGIGESVFIDTHSKYPVELGHRNIIVAEDLGTKIKITGKQLGRSYIQLPSKRIPVSVVHKDFVDLQKNLSQLVSQFQGLTFVSQKNSCSINGELLSVQDWEDIYKLQKQYPVNCSFEASIHPLIRTSVKNKLSRYLDENHLSSANIQITETMKIQIAKLTKKQTKKAQEDLKPWGLHIHVMETVLPRPDLVQVKLLLAEVSKSHSQSLGLNWSQNFQANILPGNHVMGNWLVTLNSLELDGNGQILASPSLVAESGGQAEFLAGGEFPIRNRGYINSNISWKKHGLSFKIKPRVDSSLRIFLSIETEVSMLDSQSAVDGIPGLKVSRLHSQFNLNDGQTVILSGLIQQRYGLAHESLPLLKSIPILGSLFSSRDYQQEKSDLVIFVQPLILKENTSVDFPKSELLHDR